MARPSIYSDELAERICDRLAAGRSLRLICQDADVPSRDTVRRWLRDRLAFRARYAQSCELRADALADEALAIADDSSRDYRSGPSGLVLDADRLRRDRLRIDARKFSAARMAPRRYGDPPRA
ncbi:terminase small subunit protein [Methylobacterium sp. J-088]|uniref:terminase small subunit-like protein n=1 Tax=Methylobacterium sp. J-088 TaxID=2836664 RepID=UPI001FB96B2B|nr:terminase small subunit protein [Methylobacterium sp. J-088]MCJ2065860.1 terminase small subunit protein [Methylobacterium sp. J-088]